METSALSRLGASVSRPRGWALGSLAGRLMLTSALWSALALILAGWMLTALYTASLVRSFDERILVYEKTLAGVVATTAEDAAPAPDNMGEPRFGRFQSGWYWMVSDAATGETVAASLSLIGEMLDLPLPPSSGAVVTSDAADWSGRPLRVVAQRIFLSSGRSYNLTVTGSLSALDDEISTFRFQVFATLAIFAFGLVMASVLQVRFGLRPLASMSRSLAAIREGRAERLEGAWPREIAPLARELNALIEANGAIVERSRSQVGNLAHALKTPLAVVLNEARAEGGTFADKVIEQVGVMRSEVERYLDRTRLAADRKIVGAKADVVRSVEGLARVMRRAHPDRVISVDVSPDVMGVAARIERRDLEEAIGNLADNACKFGREQIQIDVGIERGGDEAMVLIAIHDDGPGLPAEDFAVALGRGKRFDETVPGSGIGLAVAAEIIETYGGRISLGTPALSGLTVAVRLPMV